MLEPILLALGALGVAYLTFLALLVAVGRTEEARALARFLPDCGVLFKRLLGDSRLPKRDKVLVAALMSYLAMPFDVVPDFIPLAGQLDDALAVALVLRRILRDSGPQLLDEHWPGPPETLRTLHRLVG